MSIYVRKKKSMASGPLFATFFMTFLFGFGIGFSMCYAWLSQTMAPSAQVTQGDHQPPAPPVPDTPKAETKHIDRESLATLNPGRHVFMSIPGTELAKEDAAFLSELKPGGIVLRDANLVSSEQSVALVTAMKQAEGFGTAKGDYPFIATYPEGLKPEKLSLADKASPEELGSSGDAARAATAGESLAKALAAFGVEVVFGPVLAPAASGTPEPLVREAFGSDPTAVTAIGLAFADGMMKAGVLPVAKYYPGFGTSGDLEKAPAMAGDVASLAKLMLPFTEALQAGMPGLMVGHSAVPAIDTRYPTRPAALSPVLVRGVLRAGNRQYEGVILAHDLTTVAVAGRFQLEEAAVQALAAGCDAIVIPDANRDQVLSVCAAITQAVHEGVLSRDRLEESKRRLEGWQAWLRDPKPLSGPLPDLSPLRTTTQPAVGETASPVEPAPVPVSTETLPAGDAASESASNEPSVPQVAETPAQTSVAPPAPDVTPSAENPVPAPPASDATPSTENPVPAPENDKPVETQPESAQPPAKVEKPEQPANTRRVVHQIKEGERLYRIAKQYGVSVNDLKKWNKLSDENIKWGKSLVVYVPEGFTPEAKREDAAPPAPAAAEPPSPESAATETSPPAEEPVSTSTEPAPAPAPETANAAPAPEPSDTSVANTTAQLDSGFVAPEGTVRVQYEIQRGDMLTKVASKFGVKQSDIMKWNRLSNPNIKFGRKIDIYVTPEKAAAVEEEAKAPAEPPSTPAENTTNTAPSQDLPALELPSATPASTEKPAPPPAPATAAIVRGQDVDYYVVAEGDTASRLAKQFGTTMSELLDMNDIDNPDHIRIGQKLKIPKQP